MKQIYSMLLIILIVSSAIIISGCSNQINAISVANLLKNGVHGEIYEVYGIVSQIGPCAEQTNENCLYLTSDKETIIVYYKYFEYKQYDLSLNGIGNGDNVIITGKFNDATKFGGEEKSILALKMIKQ